MTEIPGRMVPGPSDEVPHFVVESAERIIWSTSRQGHGVIDAYQPGFAAQGADIMPRRLVFFDTTPADWEVDTPLLRSNAIRRTGFYGVMRKSIARSSQLPGRSRPGTFIGHTCRNTWLPSLSLILA